MQQTQKIITLLLATCFLAFVVLSWWLLFRDERALAGIGFFYPHLAGWLFATRTWLLDRSVNLLPTLLFAATSLVAFATYLVSLRLNFSKRTSITMALVFQVVAFFSYPVLSTDIFSYIYSDRVLFEYGQNPWEVAPGNFPDDSFGLMADWTDQTRVYGLVNQIIYWPAAVIGAGQLLSTVLSYKLVAVVFYLAALATSLKLVEKWPEKRQALLVRAIFWNPLIVLEFVSSAHNDIAMIFFLLLSLAFWNKKVWFLAGMLIALSVQVKLIPVLAFGFFTLQLLQEKNLRALTQYTLSFLAVNFLSFALMGISPLSFLERVLYNTTVYWQSLPELVERFLPGITMPFALIFVVVVAALAALQIKNGWPPLKTTALALALYLVFFSAANWNWYILWPFVLILFLEENSGLKNYLLLATGTALMAYPLLWFSHRFGFGHPAWSLATYLLIFVLPLIAIKINNVKKLRHTPLLGEHSRLYYGTSFNK